MGLNDIFHRFKTLAVIASLGILALFLLGAAPHQGGVPPQPYGANFFSGLVKVQGVIPPVGTKIIGCVANCAEIFESEPALTDADGNYVALKLNPDDEGLVGRIITFYVVNEFGRTVANETRRFEGDFNIYPLDLTFADPIPVYTPPAVIPTTLSVVPKTGLVTTVNGTGFASNSMVTVTSEGMDLGTAPTDDLGSFRLIITAPSSISGAYEITSTDSEGTSTNVTLMVPDLSGPIGEVGMPGESGESGVLGEQGLPGEDASIVLGVVALSLAGLGILIIVVIYLYLISWFNDLARRLPPPGIR
ncbi:MAG: hypothetical protein HQ475_13910 [SAR202 cluster bacterium]|nr:hypothetical protein [SAR202 cluster bacterium]